MKFSLRWLQSYLELTVPVPELLEKLTLAGTEVERVTSTGVNDSHIVIGQILASTPHPNADRLRVCRVQDGQGERQIVCGAKNFKDGDKAPLALPGAKLPGGMEIKESKLRGELSQGMLCSAKELNLAEDAEGLLLLPADAPVGMKFSDYRPGDTLVEVEVTPNRPDLLCYLGLAREIAALGAGKVKLLPPDVLHFPVKASAYTATLSDPDLGPYYSAIHLQKVRVGPSPAWLQEAIVATGHRPINNVVDITNYVLFETGQPLHAFDAAKLKGNVLNVRRAKAGEKIEALDQLTYELKPDDLVIADASGPVALAGVMGGRMTGVSDTTTELILEAAWFTPGAVRKTSRRLGLISDSSYRYERRVDPAGLIVARDRAIALLQKWAVAELVSSPCTVGKLPDIGGPITLRAQRIEQVLGIKLPAATVNKNLTALGLKKGSQAEDTWQPPSYRADLTREIDLIEELARLHGLQGIPGRLVAGAPSESIPDRGHRRLLKLRHILAARGWDECVTDALIERRFINTTHALELANPLSELYTHLRPSLKTSLLQVAAKNLARGVAGVRLFEVGLVFQKEKQTTHESIRLGLLVAGKVETAAWFRAERSADYFDLTGPLAFLQAQAGINGADGVETAVVGPEELKIHGLKVPVFYAEIDLERWRAEGQPLPERFQPVPAYPSMRRDLAIVLPRTTPQAQVETILQGAHAPHLENVQLFDIFQDDKGEKISAEQKSLAYALTYRAPDRTLTEKEVNESHALIRQKLADEFHCTFRE